MNEPIIHNPSRQCQTPSGLPRQCQFGLRLLLLLLLPLPDRISRLRRSCPERDGGRADPAIVVPRICIPAMRASLSSRNFSFVVLDVATSLARLAAFARSLCESSVAALYESDSEAGLCTSDVVVVVEGDGPVRIACVSCVAYSPAFDDPCCFGSSCTGILLPWTAVTCR